MSEETRDATITVRLPAKKKAAFAALAEKRRAEAAKSFGSGVNFNMTTLLVQLIDRELEEA